MKIPWGCKSSLSRVFTTVLCVLIFTAVLFSSFQVVAQASEEQRKLKKGAPAAYPEMAKPYNLHGTVRVQLLVTPEGKVKETKVLGGNPVLAKALVEAVSKWEYQPANHSSIIIVTADFKP